MSAVKAEDIERQQILRTANAIYASCTHMCPCGRLKSTRTSKQCAWCMRTPDQWFPLTDEHHAAFKIDGVDAVYAMFEPILDAAARLGGK